MSFNPLRTKALDASLTAAQAEDSANCDVEGRCLVALLNVSQLIGSVLSLLVFSPRFLRRADSKKKAFFCESVNPSGNPILTSPVLW